MAVRVEGSYLVISDPNEEQEVCHHKIAMGKGNKAINTDHKGDKTASIQEMIEQVSALLPDAEKAKEWINIK